MLLHYEPGLLQHADKDLQDRALRATKRKRAEGQEGAAQAAAKPAKVYDLGDGDMLEFIPDDPDVPVGDYEVVTEDERSMEEFLESWK